MRLTTELEPVERRKGRGRRGGGEWSGRRVVEVEKRKEWEEGGGRVRDVGQGKMDGRDRRGEKWRRRRGREEEG